MSKISIDRTPVFLGINVEYVEPTQEELVEVYRGCELGLRHLGEADEMVEVVKVKISKTRHLGLGIELTVVLKQLVGNDRKFEAKIGIREPLHFSNKPIDATMIAYSLANLVKASIHSEIEKEEENIRKMHQMSESIRNTVISA